MEFIVKVKDLTAFALSEEAGKKLRDIIVENWESYNTIKIDFSGIDIFATPFFNYSLAYCILNYNPDEYDKKIVIINLNSLGQETYQHSKNNAVNFYNKKIDMNEVNEITKKTIEESEL